MAKDREAAIGQAPGLPDGQRGHVYIAGWRMDPLRPVVREHLGARRWPAATTTATIDQTTAGLVLASSGLTFDQAIPTQ
jgi:hypothetical protein